MYSLEAKVGMLVILTEIVNDADSDQSVVAQFPYLNCFSQKSFQDLLLRSFFFVTIYHSYLTLICLI